MKKFEPLQKVVFSTAKLRIPLEFYQALQPDKIFPSEGEIVTVFKMSPSNPGFWILREYPVNNKGTFQAISELVLFPFEQVHAEFNEKLLNKVTEKLHSINV